MHSQLTVPSVADLANWKIRLPWLMLALVSLGVVPETLRVITSSTMRSTPYVSQISRTRAKYSAVPSWTPCACMIGSAMNAATMSGPSCRIWLSDSSFR